jgi:hypothetical protein
VEQSAPKSKQQLTLLLQDLRARLERAFSSETAARGFEGTAPSTGQCAAVAAIINQLLGGSLLSANVDGHSHWFNQISLEDMTVEVDLTGDQFGRPPVQINQPWSLYPDTRVRTVGDLKAETLIRSALLARRAGLADAEAALRKSAEHKLDEEVSL